MYLFAQPWCGACKRLKADFEANGEALVPVSKEFIMVNIYGDDNKMFGVKPARRVFVLGYCSAFESAVVCCTLQQPAPYPGRKPYRLKHMDCNLQAEYAPDGGYIPRIMFADNTGRLTPEVKNPSASPQCAPDFSFHSRVGGLTGAKGALALLELWCIYCKLLCSSPLPKHADSPCVALCVQVQLLLPVVRRGENPC